MKREDIEKVQDLIPGRLRMADEPMVSITESERDELCRLALRATDPEYVMVPREPTQDMMAAAMNVKGKYVPPGRLYAFYSAMIAAAAQEDQP